jgi:hypothetical protein
MSIGAYNSLLAQFLGFPVEDTIGLNSNTFLQLSPSQLRPFTLELTFCTFGLTVH